MQTPPTNDAAARVAAVKARWKRAVRAVQEPLTPSVADELPPRPPLVRSHTGSCSSSTRSLSPSSRSFVSLHQKWGRIIGEPLPPPPRPASSSRQRAATPWFPTLPSQERPVVQVPSPPATSPPAAVLEPPSPPADVSTQTLPPPADAATQTVPPLPDAATQTDAPPPEVATQTLVPPPPPPPPPSSQPLWSGPPSHPLWLIPDDLDPAAGLIDRMTLERLMLAHRPTTATRPRPFEYLLAETRDALSEVTLRSGASVGAPLRREHRAARPPPRTGRDWLTASERLQLACWIEIGEYEARTWRRP